MWIFPSKSELKNFYFEDFFEFFAERRVDSPDFVYFLAESLLPVDYTLAHQAGMVITNAAFQLQKFNPLFTLVFTQITSMEFTVFGNILSNQSQSRVTLEKLCVEF